MVVTLRLEQNQPARRSLCSNPRARNSSGSGNFCLLTSDPVELLAHKLRAKAVEIVAGPDEREGATGKLLSIYFRDPDGNLIEVSNLI